MVLIPDDCGKKRVGSGSFAVEARQHNKRLFKANHMAVTTPMKSAKPQRLCLLLVEITADDGDGMLLLLIFPTCYHQECNHRRTAEGDCCCAIWNFSLAVLQGSACTKEIDDFNRDKRLIGLGNGVQGQGQ